jgi:RNA polymerase sigma factor (sigma-70 family)
VGGERLRSTLLERVMTLRHDDDNQPGAFLNEYIDGLYGYSLVLTRNQAEAEDLVQETCVRAIEAMGRLRTDRDLKIWLFTILRNIWLNEPRQRRTASEMVEIDVDRENLNRDGEKPRLP